MVVDSRVDISWNSGGMVHLLPDAVCLGFLPGGYRQTSPTGVWGVTARLLAEAKLSLQLAQARYRPGLSSIVELSQA